jgi:hypothetical protein
MNIQYKNIMIGLIAILSIFVSYYYLQPLNNEGQKLSKNQYTLKTYNINKDNKWATFRTEKNGRFFIHSGKVKAPKGVFTFKNDMEVILDYSIRKSGKVGEIEFKTILNKKEIAKNIVTLKNPTQVKIFVNKGDVLEIIADKYGNTGQDHGNLQITVKQTADVFKLFIIPFFMGITFYFLTWEKA